MEYSKVMRMDYVQVPAARSINVTNERSQA